MEENRVVLSLEEYTRLHDVAVAHSKLIAVLESSIGYDKYSDSKLEISKDKEVLNTYKFLYPNEYENVRSKIIKESEKK